MLGKSRPVNAPPALLGDGAPRRPPAVLPVWGVWDSPGALAGFPAVGSSELRMLQAVLFYTFAIIAALAGIVVITRRNAIASAVALVVCFFFLSGIYVMLDAHFVAVIQVLVYAGAIMVLFIFVIMLLNMREEGVGQLGHVGARAVGGLAVAGVVWTGLLVALDALRPVTFGPAGEGFGTIESVGTTIFGGRYLLPFEAASVLLTIAMVGAVVLAKRRL
jgi:NADH-quinone oxidoreductase subunit J